MERFSRFRRYKKATAAAVTAATAPGSLPAIGMATGNLPAPETPADTVSSAGTPTPTQDTPFSAPTPIPRPATAAGTITSTLSAPAPPEIPSVPSIHASSDSVRPMTSLSHAPSTAPYVVAMNGAPPSSASPSPQDAQAQTQAQTQVQPPNGVQAPQTAQQKMRGAMRISRSPFRNFIRSSTKRPRGSPPSTPPASTHALLPASPTTVINVQMQNISFPSSDASPRTSPSPPKKADGASISTPASTLAPALAPALALVPATAPASTSANTATNGTQQEGRRSMQSATSSNKPALPSFLKATPREIQMKFHDLVWLERSRLQNSIAQPTGRWARVPGRYARALDRYANIQPWDRNRIKLKVPPGHAEYINASPIVLTTTAPAHAARPPDRFIAMQGPQQNSVDHVWRMVYEQLRSPAVIVMLTETHEGPYEKCYPYFPRNPGEPPMQINECDEFGDGFRATVRCESIEETPYGDAIELRRIVLRVHRRASQPTPNEAGGGDGGAPLLPKPAEDDDTEMGGAPLRRASSSATAASVAGGVKIDADVAEGETEENEAETSEAGEALPAAAPAKPTEDDIDMADYEDERIVYHFLYKRWPDYGVPALDDLDSFLGLMRLSAEKNADHDNPRIVHCSAGVGRSGTFIALEHLQRELEAGVFEDEAFAAAAPPAQNEGGTPDVEDDIVFSTVNQLREQRRMMVQAESQYMFIYRVLRKLWEDKYGVRLPATTSTLQEAVPENIAYTSSYVSEPAAKRLEVDPHPDRKYLTSSAFVRM